MPVYSDINISLDKKRDGDVNISYEENAINNALLNIFSTIKGERRMLPTFGSNIHQYLFEPLDKITAYSIGEEIFNAINYWDGRIKIEQINVIPKHDMNAFYINIKYYITSDPLNLKEFIWILKRS